jgi:hypothetical protein
MLVPFAMLWVIKQSLSMCSFLDRLYRFLSYVDNKTKQWTLPLGLHLSFDALPGLVL